MLGAAHDIAHNAFDVATDRSGPVADALRRPLGVEPVMRRHVLLHRRIPQAAASFDAEVESDPEVVVEYLDRSGCREDRDLFPGVGIGDAVVVAILPDFNMVIGPNGGKAVVCDFVAAFR